MAKRILVPLDGSETAEAAATLAGALARSTGGHVRLLQVRPVPQHRVSSAGRVVAYADPEMRLGPVPTETVVRFGKPEEEILVEAEAFDADLIVVTTEKRGWLGRLAGRGLGERLLQDSPVPVALVRAA